MHYKPARVGRAFTCLYHDKSVIEMLSTSSNNPWDGIVPEGDSHMVRW